jgi:hypothetical protein
VKKLIFSILAVVVSMSFAQSLIAQSNNSVGLSISPAIVEIAGDPGTQQKAMINVKNTSDKPLPVRLEVTSLIPIEDELDRSRRAEFDASSWVTLSKKDALLAPGETNLVLADIAIPKEANPGGHYAQIGFRVVSEANYDPTTNAQIVPEVASALFITVSGDIDEKAEFNTDNLVPSYVARGEDTSLKFYIKNTGNVHILPAPKITISNSSGQVKEFTLQPQLILPNTQKEFTLDWPVDVGFGNYSARVETVYGSQSLPLVSESSNFRVGPVWWQILLVFIALIPLLYILVRRRHIPNFLKVLSGKRIHFVGKKKYSRADSETSKRKQKKMPENYSEYDSISEFLGEPETSIARVKAEPEAPRIEMPSAVPANDPPVKEAQVINVAMSKSSEESLKSVPASPKATITEFANTDNASTKTVIVQTSASTIIRQEPKKEQIEKVSTVPTIVRAPQPEKPKISIVIKDGNDTPKPKPKIYKPKPIQPATRSEKTAQKALKAQKKIKKQKL